MLLGVRRGAASGMQHGSRKFWPTRLAIALTSANAAAAESHLEGFIILETNFDLYAYTGAEHAPRCSFAFDDDCGG